MRMHFVQTYDLSTKVGRMGLVGIHTPTVKAVSRLYPGFFSNFKRWKPASCDITMACASLLPADPLQVGVEAGEIAPQDMFNPILYKAVTNDSMDMVLSRIKNRLTGNAVTTAAPSSKDYIDVVDIPDPFPSFTDINNEDMYYSLLAGDGWKKAMPQAGLRMSGLIPLVYEVLGNYGNTAGMAQAGSTPQGVSVPTISSSSTAVIGQDGAGSNLGNAYTGLGYWKGASKPMPSIPTNFLSNTTPSTAVAGDVAGGSLILGDCPITYVSLLVLPPAKLNVLYYRLRVDWSIEWYDPCPVTEQAMPNGLAAFGAQLYWNTYQEVSSKMDSLAEMVDSADMNMDMIMESGR